MSYISNEDLRNLCIQNGWFEGGTEEQYEKLFEANTSGASDEKLSIMIYLCSDTSQEKILEVLQNYKIIPSLGDIYWKINGHGTVISDKWNCAEKDIEAFSCGNCFATEESALRTLKSLKVYSKLKRFAEANNTEKIDWNNCAPKFVFAYSYKNRAIECVPRHYTRQAGEIYFSSMGIAQKAIEFVGKDNIKKYLFGIEE